MRRQLRIAAIGLLLTLAALLLAACQRPVPRITVQTGSFSTTIVPSTYCFDATQCRTSAAVDFPVVDADPDATVLIDVPRAVADTGWVVKVLAVTGSSASGTPTATTGTASGTATGTATGAAGTSGGNAVRAIGRTPTIRGVHTYRVAASANNGNSFIVEVNQVRSGSSDGSTWSFLVQTSQS